jgi:ubiquinone/menaquinone biosynthesis C-methylase UbiE
MAAFDDLSQAYDNSIDWDSRLSREMPFLLSILGPPEGKRVLDLACGSGRHAVFLAVEGAEVIGLDTSKTMIQMAKKHAQSEDVKVNFIVADMKDILSVVEGSFDFVTCLGNSLALLPEIESVRQVLRGVHEIMKIGGSFVAQMLNFEEIHWTGFRSFPPKTGRLNDGTEVTFSRLLEHTDYPDSSTLIMASFRGNEQDTFAEVSTQKVLNLNQRIIDEALRSAQFEDFEVYADFDRSLFDRKYSRNMVVRADKRI